MNIVIDIGNTRSKFASFVNGILQKPIVYSLNDLYSIWGEAGIRGSNVIISGSGDINSSELLDLVSKCKKSFVFSTSQSLKLPISLDYLTTGTLGVDRVADAVAASLIYPQKEILIIDMGTAITLDRVSKEGAFLGGNISVGVDLRFASLNAHTDKLPRLYLDEKVSLKNEDCGKSTNQAILNGVVLGVKYEVLGYAEKFLKMYPDGVVVLTGGDAKVLNNNKMLHFNLEHALGLIGLNAILEYNL